jgi:CheY-like chemotaxis protein
MTAVTPPPTILLVDDDPTVRFLLHRQVNRHWPLVHVLEAENGEQGLAFVQAHCQAITAANPLLVILDLKMPVLNGLGFLHRFHQLPDDCKQGVAVVVSSTSTHPLEVDQVQPLATALWPKPLLTEHLKQLLGQYLPTALKP